MRLTLGHRIAAHHAGEARPQAQLLEQRIGEPRRLVGDNTGLQAPPGERIEHLGHAGKEPRALAQSAAVDLEEAPLQDGGTLGRGIRESAFHEARGAMAHDDAQLLIGQRCEALLAAQGIQRAHHVRGRVEQGAVQIE